MASHPAEYLDEESNRIIAIISRTVNLSCSKKDHVHPGYTLARVRETLSLQNRFIVHSRSFPPSSKKKKEILIKQMAKRGNLFPTN